MEDRKLINAAALGESSATCIPHLTSGMNGIQEGAWPANKLNRLLLPSSFHQTLLTCSDTRRRAVCCRKFSLPSPPQTAWMPNPVLVKDLFVRTWARPGTHYPRPRQRLSAYYVLRMGRTTAFSYSPIRPFRPFIRGLLIAFTHFHSAVLCAHSALLNPNTLFVLLVLLVPYGVNISTDVQFSSQSRSHAGSRTRSFRICSQTSATPSPQHSGRVC